MGHARRDQAQTATDPATGRARKTARATERLIPDHIGPRERRDPTRDPTSRHRHRALEFCGSKFSSFFWVWLLASPKSKSSCDCGIWRFVHSENRYGKTKKEDAIVRSPDAICTGREREDGRGRRGREGGGDQGSHAHRTHRRAQPHPRPRSRRCARGQEGVAGHGGPGQRA
jgi:hypothetical protein